MPINQDDYYVIRVETQSSNRRSTDYYLNPEGECVEEREEAKRFWDRDAASAKLLRFLQAGIGLDAASWVRARVVRVRKTTA